MHDINLKPASLHDARPFVKWAGGKSKLLPQLDALLPGDLGQRRDITYIEPFVGGGAMLLHILSNYRNITRAIINDNNAPLMCCYRSIRDTPHELMRQLALMRDDYRQLSADGRKQYYLAARQRYNQTTHNESETAALLIFLNHTCFNGLYRVNRSGAFNVPHGRYANPAIYDEDAIMADSRLLQGIQITTGDFSHIAASADANAFVYIDPPYRPLTTTAAFCSYTKEAFGDNDQCRLKAFCDTLDARGARFMLSNSDGLSYSGDNFLHQLYADYDITHITAPRAISRNVDGRKPVPEIVVRNYR